MMRIIAVFAVAITLTVLFGHGAFASSERVLCVEDGFLAECAYVEVRGDSMEPSLYEGDTLLVAKVSYRQVTPGDMVVFHNLNLPTSGNLVVHRAILVGYDDLGWYAVTQGDNRPTPDAARVRMVGFFGIVSGVVR